MFKSCCYLLKYKMTPPVTSILNNANGINTLHPRCINWSYLNLGIVHLTHMNKNIKKDTFNINASTPNKAAIFGDSAASFTNGIS